MINVVSCQQSESFGRFENRLKQAGLNAYNLPIIETIDEVLNQQLELKIRKAICSDFLIFTSKACVSSFAKLMAKIGLNSKDVSAKIISIGKKTSYSLDSMGYAVDIENKGENSSQLADYLDCTLPVGSKIFQVRGNLASKNLEEKLSKKFNFDFAVVYKTIVKKDVDKLLVQFVNEGKIDCLAFCSPSEVEGFWALEGLNIETTKNILVYTIGSVTAKTAQKYFKTVIISASPDVEVLADNIITNFCNIKN